MRSLGGGVAMLWAITLVAVAHAAEPDLAAISHLRQPVAIAVNGQRVYVANRACGSISVLDMRGSSFSPTGAAKVIGEYRLGHRLSDLAITPGGTLLTTDETGDTLIALRPDGDGLRTMSQLSLHGAPVSIAVTPDGAMASVATLWARRVTLVNLVTVSDESGGPSQLRMLPGRVIDLPFSPRTQLLTPDNKLIVADAFGGRIAVIGVNDGRILALRSIEGHNIRGLALSPDSRTLHIAHALLDTDSPTTRSMTFYGFVISSMIRSIDVAHLLDEPYKPGDAASPIAHWRLYALGETNNGAGDPGGMAMLRDGSSVITLSGVDEVAVWKRGAQRFERLKVGRRPTAMAIAPDGRHVYVSNTFDDTLTVVDVPSAAVQQLISLGPTPAPGNLTLPQQGEQLFYSARLSLHGWSSCHSCHTDGHTNSLVNDNFGDDSFGTPKQIPTLLGVADTDPWAWHGGQRALATQVRKSIRITLQGEEMKTDTQANADAIETFLRTLNAPPSVTVARGTIDQDAIERGRVIFRDEGCADCHVPGTYTSTGTFDVGLRDEAGRRKFNPPSLCGVSQRDALFHDGRAKSVREVLTKFRHPHGNEIKGETLEDLIRFVESL